MEKSKNDLRAFLDLPRVEVYRPEHIIRSSQISAMHEVAVMGRGSAKTRGLTADRIVQNISRMPQSLNALVCSSYKKIMGEIMPALKAGLRDLHYYENVHYYVGKFGPEDKGFPKPHMCPEKPSQLIHFVGGGAVQFFSLAVAGSMNGISVDSLTLEEAKLIKQAQYESECVPANRGNMEHFSDCHLHHGTLIVTDMPTNQSGDWILQKADLMNVDQITLIEELQRRADSIKLRMILNDYTEISLQELQYELNALEKDLFILRRGRKNSKGKWSPAPAFNFSMASALDNIHALGEDYLDIQSKNLTPIEFRASVLNMRTEMAGQKFYPFLDSDIHGYQARFSDASHEHMNIGDDADLDSSRYDLDVAHERPLDVAFDYGASILTSVIAQEFNSSYRLLNARYKKHPHKIADLVDDICDYYGHHKNKVVNYYYDHTAIGKGGINDDDYSKAVVSAFNRRGWKVNGIYCGQAPGHEERYLFFQQYFKGELNVPAFEYNQENCEEWETAMNLTAVTEGRRGIEKDKRKERDEKYPQEKAPHITDAFDTLIWFKWKVKVDHINSDIGWVSSN